LDAEQACALSDYKDLPYYVAVAREAAARASDVERFVISYARAVPTVLTARDVWFLVGDETAMPVGRVPPCPLFCTYGRRFYTPRRGFPLDLPLQAAELALAGRNKVRAVRAAWPGVRSTRRPRCGWLPLGTPAADIAATTVPPPDQRTYDIGFRGSLGGGKRYAPRTISRRRMVDALAELPSATRIDLFETESFVASYHREPDDYAARLFDTKICLAPRGGSLETYRTFEAALSGCVLITEPLPPAWFYESLPRREVRSWSELPEIAGELLADPAAMRSIAASSRRWALEVVSPSAVGAWVAQNVGRWRR
jgi:hypothetical protein